MKNHKVLILPGWQGSGHKHWQMRWAQLYGYQVVEQHDWHRPLRGDWLARLDDVVSDLSEPIYLVAHSLGCIQVAAWAQVSAQCHKVHGALLVAPGDVEVPQMQAVFSSWQPIELKRLPFNSLLIGSQNDPYCTTERAQLFASAWGSEWLNLGACGHVNAESNLGDWQEGHALLSELMKEIKHGH
jgi:predicted alpha/beta hydrolase family esterase